MGAGNLRTTGCARYGFLGQRSRTSYASAHQYPSHALQAARIVRYENVVH